MWGQEMSVPLMRECKNAGLRGGVSLMRERKNVGPRDE